MHQLGALGSIARLPAVSPYSLERARAIDNNLPALGCVAAWRWRAWPRRPDWDCPPRQSLKPHLPEA